MDEKRVEEIVKDKAGNVGCALCFVPIFLAAMGGLIIRDYDKRFKELERRVIALEEQRK